MSDEAIPSELTEAPKSCPICGGISFHHDYVNGEIICTKCGLVVAEQPPVSREMEWRTFEGEPSHPRATPISNPTHIVGATNQTKISVYGMDSNRNKLPTETNAEYLRLSKMNNRASGENASLARTIAVARSLFSTYKYKLNIPDSVDDHIFDIFTKAEKANLIRGRSVHQILVACMYYCLRENGIPTTIENVEAVTGITKKDIGRCYRLMLKIMKIRPKRRDPAIFISQFCSKLNLPGEFEMTARGIFERAQAKKITAGSSPICIAACAIYLAAKKLDYDISQKTIAEVCGVTEVSIRNHTRKYHFGGVEI